jgi:uncharacterized protein YciI
MYYVIIALDKADSLSDRIKARPQHLERLQELRDAGRLLTAGPCPHIDSEDPGPAGFSGSVIIAEFDSVDAARSWADDDPYVKAGVYDSVEIKPFKKVF